MHNYFYYYFYSIVSGIALCVHLIINWHQLVNRPNARAHIGALDFRRFVACLTIYFVTDVLWGVFAALKWPRVLVVDDSPVNRAVLKAMLAKSGVADVVMTENGRKALAALEANDDFEIVLSDLWMPEMDGYELVRAIRADARFSHLPVYLLTADVEARNQAESSGFTGILLKPITLEKLQALFA